MAQRRSSATQDDIAFAEAVLNLYRSRLGTNPAEGHDDPEVCEVAAGLLSIKQALERERAHIKAASRPIDEPAATGIVSAMRLLDALTTGCEHPVRRYVQGLHSRSTHRPSPGDLEILGRAIVIGAVRELRAQGVPKASRMACEHFSGERRRLTFEQLKRWDRAFKERSNIKFTNEFVAATQNDLLAAAGRLPTEIPLPERILLAAKGMLVRFWVTPKFQKGA